MKSNKMSTSSKLRLNSHLANQKGGMAALLSVIVLSMVIVTSLSSVYIYLENRAKFQGRLKMSYQITYVMEEIARIASQGYDLADQEGDPSDTNLSSNGISCAGMREIVLGGTPTAVVLCIPVANASTTSSGICVTNPSIQDEPFCVHSDESIDPPILTPPLDASLLDGWYNRLDQFFDTTIIRGAPTAQRMAWNFLEADFQPPTYLGWLLPQAAYAGDQWGSYHQVDGQADKVVEDPTKDVLVVEDTKPEVITEPVPIVEEPRTDILTDVNPETQVVTQPNLTTQEPPGYFDQIMNYYNGYFGTQGPLVEVRTDEPNNVNPETQPGVVTTTQPGANTTNPDTGENFLGLNPGYLDSQIRVQPIEGGRTPPTVTIEGPCGTGSLSSGQNCTTLPPTVLPTTVAITTNTCETVNGHIQQDDPGSSCFRCFSQSGAGAGANIPCFRMSLGNPFNAASPYRMSVRLIR